MEDDKIIGLYNARDEAAIRETDIKYGALCRKIAGNILNVREDQEEAVSDTYLGVWNTIPPERPRRFPAFIGRIARNLSLKKYEYLTAEKRSAKCVLSLEELAECVSGAASPESELENRRIENAINAFLEGQDMVKRRAFVRRYWYFDSVSDIAKMLGFTTSKVSSMLHGMRIELREYLESEDIEI